MRKTSRFAAPFCLASALLACGCKKPPADDASVTAAVQTRLAADSAISSEPIQSSVQGGIATLTGSVSSEAARSLAANDAAHVAGVRTVVNNLSVAPAAAQQPAAQQPAPPANPVPSDTANMPPERVRTERTKPSARAERQKIARNEPPAPIIEQQPAPTVNQNPVPAPAPPPPPPQPAFRDLTIPAGASISVRVTQTLDSATTQQGDSFSGSVASDVLVDGIVAIPQGSAVSGRVDAVQEAAHFKGNSLLTVSLTSISRRGEKIPVSTEAFSKQGAGRGKNTAIKTGAGAAAGAILGGIFGGGSGAAIGAAAGGAGGAGINGITRGQQVQIQSESLVPFRLTSPVTVRVRVNERNHAPDARDPSNQTDQSRRPLS